MRRIGWFFGCIVISTAALVNAEDALQKPSISVTGTVETKVAPDLVVWSISLVDRNKNLREAKAMNDEKVKAVIALRDQLRLEEGDLETGHVSIQREYERDQSGQRTGEFKNFVVNRHVTIRQPDLDRFDEFLDALVGSADMDMNFHFETSKMHEVRAETRLKALKAAKDKAEALAVIANSRIGKPLKIDEHPTDGGRSSFTNNMAFSHSAPTADQASDTFIPGAIRVQVTIHATFELK